MPEIYGGPPLVEWPADRLAVLIVDEVPWGDDLGSGILSSDEVMPYMTLPYMTLLLELCGEDRAGSTTMEWCALPALHRVFRVIIPRGKEFDALRDLEKFEIGEWHFLKLLPDDTLLVPISGIAPVWLMQVMVAQLNRAWRQKSELARAVKTAVAANE